MQTFTLLFMLLVLVSLAVGEVVESFQESCSEFFIPDPQDENKHIIPTIPQGDQYKQICQKWKNKYQYATLFDTVNRIPVYSAYTYYTSEKVERIENWKNEPQLDNDEEMLQIPEDLFSQALEKDYRGKQYSKDRIENWKNEPQLDNDEEMLQIPEDFFFQALERDYKGTQYSKGHVFPNLYGVDKDQKDSSFTMTNVAPQTEPSNNEWADKVEKPMLEDIKKKCKPSKEKPAYIVTGVVPGQRWMSIIRGETDDEHGVNIPTHYWTAFSCTKDGEPFSDAYLAEQQQPGGRTFEPKKITLDELNSELSKLYQTEFIVFPPNQPQRRISILKSFIML